MVPAAAASPVNLSSFFRGSRTHVGHPRVPLRVRRLAEVAPPNAVDCFAWIDEASVPVALNLSNQVRELKSNCAIEVDEWTVVEALVTPERTVLELGARYGTTSCWLAHATNNSGRVVSVEPDVRVHGLLLHNLARNRCNVAVVLGTVAAEQPLALHHSPYGYNSQSRLATASDVLRGKALPNVGVQWLEERIGAQFDTILVDCEGCLKGLAHSVPGRALLLQADLLLIEEDGFASYGYYWSLLRSMGFVRVWQSEDTVNMPHIVHSGWAKGRGLHELGRRFTGPVCQSFKASHHYHHHHLRCMPVLDWHRHKNGTRTWLPATAA